jgi:hypothetical protein
MEKLGEPVLLWGDLSSSWIFMVRLAGGMGLTLGFNNRILETCIIFADILSCVNCKATIQDGNGALCTYYRSSYLVYCSVS